MNEVVHIRFYRYVLMEPIYTVKSICIDFLKGADVYGVSNPGKIVLSKPADEKDYKKG